MEEELKPFLSIGIISFNRFKYLKAQITSMNEFLGDEKYEFYIVDNCSTESGLVDYIKDLEKQYKNVRVLIRPPEERDWINDEYKGINSIIENTSSDMLIILQDDNQFLWDKETMDEVVNEFKRINVPCLYLNAVRQFTVDQRVNSHLRYVKLEKSDNKFWLCTNNHFSTTGLFHRKVFDDNGKHPVDWPTEKEYWGRSETFYANKVKQNYGENSIIALRPHVPLFAGVWNDPRGGYAFIRGDYRYGQYLDPVDESGLYYVQRSYKDYKMIQKKNERILSFPALVKGVGWDYAKDENGDQLKYGQNKVLQEGPKSKF